MRVASVFALAYVVTSAVVLTRRTLRADIAMTGGWTLVGFLVIVNMIAAVTALATGSRRG